MNKEYYYIDHCSVRSSSTAMEKFLADNVEDAVGKVVSVEYLEILKDRLVYLQERALEENRRLRPCAISLDLPDERYYYLTIGWLSFGKAHLVLRKVKEVML